MQSGASDASFLGPETNEDSNLHQSVYMPSAPPLSEAADLNCSGYKEVLEAEPPDWLPDSACTSCMSCNAPFTIICGRHHCRFCGSIFCRTCTIGRCLLPAKFRERDPQMVCNACYDRLDSLQGLLINSISNAMQVAKHDVMDWTSMRGWLNMPVCLSMEQEIYKASNKELLPDRCNESRKDHSSGHPERCRRAGYFDGCQSWDASDLQTRHRISGSQKSDGSWSAPSAILSLGLGWGAQVGGGLTDFIIVLYDSKAVQTFCQRIHFSLGAGFSAAAGPFGTSNGSRSPGGNRGIRHVLQIQL